ncbi:MULTISPECIES: ribosome small subunit-dependent GTPase A [unclassified Arcicella]|uniref:ribosome small subunit-dependent GTPase A n=1 Tax=unclassified Arcicella TaxID=2644986 RepID=UPI002862D6AF|nr:MULTISPECIES: ribosome small subunit-dependent GTPase A [unclassified Arcicella]MDR6563232.1 ribosome biogenesis GTPase [Arcicella sp. BE51]MDR6811617.1 ribosome biogenesis GTPase [Arcicella sp. BE140]MDR6823143.1 ribosome biogenesis GTPase [Arcicella sp. BE139]
MKGLVLRSTGSWYEVLDENKHVWQCRLKGKFKIQGLKTSNPIAVGDRVEFEIEDKTENMATIFKIDARENYIIRKSVHKTAHGHILAANLDQAVIIVTLNYPRTSLGFIDRFLVSAESFRIPTTIVFNKIDLLSEEEKDYLADLAAMYEEIGYPCVFTSAVANIGIKTFNDILKDKISLVSGHSGVGKSTLVNQIAPTLDLKTTEISTFANKGVHTTTFATMFELEENTFIIDTPGIKELGLIDIDKQELSHFFPEMRALLGQCKYHNCKHINEPKCAVLEAVAEGTIAESRYNSYLSMMSDDDNRR